MQTYNFDRWLTGPFSGKSTVKVKPKSYTNPQEVLKDRHLTATQKKFILETMLGELRDIGEGVGAYPIKAKENQLAKQRSCIMKAKSCLQ